MNGHDVKFKNIDGKPFYVCSICTFRVCLTNYPNYHKAYERFKEYHCDGTTNIPATKKLKFGMDFHGVIDSNAPLFSALTKALRAKGHEIHIITGPEITTEIMEQLYKWDIVYTHYFSIVHENKRLGVDMRIDEKGHAHMHPYLWDKTKGEYCARVGIDLHFDDSDKYDYFFTTPYARFYNKDTDRAKKMSL